MLGLTMKRKQWEPVAFASPSLLLIARKRRVVDRGQE